MEANIITQMNIVNIIMQKLLLFYIFIAYLYIIVQTIPKSKLFLQFLVCEFIKIRKKISYTPNHRMK